MSKLIQQITRWATDTLFPAGVLPWSGQPTKLQPPAGIQASGIAPNQQLSAERFNWLLNGLETSVEVLTHASLNRWSTCNVQGYTNPIGKFLVPFTPDGTMGSIPNRQQCITVTGTKISNTHALFGLSSNGTDFRGFGLDLSFAPYVSLAADPFGVLFGGLAGVTTCKSNNPVTGTATFTPGNTQPAQAAWYSNAHYLIGAQAQLCTASTLGGAWASTSYGAAGDQIRQFVDNGFPASGNTVVIFAMLVNFNGNQVVYYSTNDGLTFTAGKNFGTVGLSLCYSPAYDRFFAMDTTNKQLWSSVDGNNWTLVKTLNASFAPAFGGKDAMACCGYAIAHLISRSVPSPPLFGIAYSFDLGATWTEVYFGDINSGSQPLNALIAANGRFFACDDFNVYASGPLEMPDALYTGT